MEEYIVSTEYDGKRRKLYLFTCLVCPTQFRAPLKAKKRYCSPECSAKASRTLVKVICAQCGTEFDKRPSALKNSKSGLYFCHRDCKDLAQKIGGIDEIQPDHYGTAAEWRGYRELAFSVYPKRCNRCGYDEYTTILVVHHKDRDRSNSAIDNLEVLCPNCHSIEHFLKQDGLYGGSNDKIKWPPMAELLQKRKEMTCIALSKELGVSTNAIAKRIKKYGA